MAGKETSAVSMRAELDDLHHDTEMPAGEVGFGAETRGRRPRLAVLVDGGTDPANLAAGRRIDLRHGDDHLVLRERAGHPTPQ
ncbi:hypothetical protein MBUL_03327 [Methylobacterium bullatum]|uniref:Uncharacterized protein n=1 Tax=Methylobacterium bullatum TaxID=570505 RepID=A0A679J7T3_9HYPH|nr:hypothetical protein MBUL_03327 [Methylobacterium bullatum]